MTIPAKPYTRPDDPPRFSAGTRMTWSEARSILEQGSAIRMDYAAGRYANCEEFAARFDAAAREIVDSLAAPAADPGSEGSGDVNTCERCKRTLGPAETYTIRGVCETCHDKGLSAPGDQYSMGYDEARDTVLSYIRNSRSASMGLGDASLIDGIVALCGGQPAEYRADAALPERPEMVRLLAEQEGISTEAADDMLRRASKNAGALLARRAAAPRSAGESPRASSAGTSPETPNDAERLDAVVINAIGLTVRLCDLHERAGLPFEARDVDYASILARAKKRALRNAGEVPVESAPLPASPTEDAR